MSTILTAYIVGAGVTLGMCLVAYSVMAHRENLGLDPKTEFAWSDFWATAFVTVLWPLIPIPLLAVGIHHFVIGPIVRRASAPELVKKALNKAP